MRAISDLDLDVFPGELLVLLGPSGCGKTTLLRLIAGLESPTSGTIRFGERVVNRVHPCKRNVAMVFQKPALFPHLTVRRNLTFGLEARGVSKSTIDKQLGEVANVLGLKDILDRKPESLSGGQGQLVALGRAMLRAPFAYLLDEPFSALDVQLRMRMRSLIRKIWSSSATATIYVTHDQEEALALGDRIAVMEDGHLHQVGSPLEVYRRPCDRFVAGFVGTPPMNLVDGQLESTNGTCRFVGADLACPLKPDRLAALDVKIPDSVVLGIRPEDLSLQEPNGLTNPSPSVRVEISGIEHLGHTQLVYAKTENGTVLVARPHMDSSWKQGDKAVLRFDQRAIHLFEGSPEGCSLLDEASHQVCR